MSAGRLGLGAALLAAGEHDEAADRRDERAPAARLPAVEVCSDSSSSPTPSATDVTGSSAMQVAIAGASLPVCRESWLTVSDT